MAWCPKCKFEYVDGIKICPDCKVELVASLDEANQESVDFVSDDPNVSEEDIEEAIMPYMDELPDEEERKEILERVKRIRETPDYKSKADALQENKSGAIVLTICGLLGALVLILNAVGVLNFPLKGFSLVLMYAVMGCLFFVFLVTGRLASAKARKLKAEVRKEKKNIDEVLNFIKEKKENGEYSINKEDDYEASYILVSEQVVKDVEEAFPDLEPGFAFYVVDRFAGDILDEN